MDVMVRALGAEDTVRLIAVSGRELCEKARLIHGLSRVCTAALGRTLMASVMMGAQLKERNAKLTSIINGGGPAGKIVCTADNGGHVKGCVENPGLELPLTSGGKLDVAGAVGR